MRLRVGEPGDGRRERPGHRDLDLGVLGARQQRVDELGLRACILLSGEGDEQLGPQGRRRLRRLAEPRHGFAIGLAERLAVYDVERGAPLGSGKMERGRRILIAGQAIEQLRRRPCRDIGAAFVLAELEEDIVEDADGLR